MILEKLLSGYTKEELEDCVKKAYSTKWDSENVVEMEKAGDIHILELFHGPTSAFKDVALTILPHLMSKAMADTDENVMILTATSGDTGKAAMAGFENVPRTGITVFYPHQKVSDIQYRQMASQTGGNVKVFAVKGNFDDAQSQVKKLFLDEDLQKTLHASKVRLSSANSINVGRLVPQIVYYFEAYKKLVNGGVIEKGASVSFSVPTGNFGNVLAGYYASLLGLPVNKFYVASNANNVLTEFIQTGRYNRNRPFLTTISPSMDILISSNLERLLYELADHDTEYVKSLMKQLAEKGEYQLSDELLAKLQEKFEAAYYDDDAARAVIKETYEKEGYVLDPHTATAYALAKEKAGNEPVIALSTASPYKFAEDVCKAIEPGIEFSDQWQALAHLQTVNKQPCPKALKDLQSAPVLHKEVVSVEEMKEGAGKFAQELFA
jgi:threonine synthase